MDNMSPEDINHPGFGGQSAVARAFVRRTRALNFNWFFTGCTAIHIAVLMGHLPVVSILASKGASLIVSLIYYSNWNLDIHTLI